MAPNIIFIKFYWVETAFQISTSSSISPADGAIGTWNWFFLQLVILLQERDAEHSERLFD